MGVEGVVKLNSDVILNRISALMGIIDFTKYVPSSKLN